MPWLPWLQVSPPSSVSHTPTADIASASLSGSPGQGAIECRHSPPPPGCQSGRVGCSHSVRLSSQVAPPSRLSNSTPGSPPAYRVPSSPGTITQIRSSACSPPSGSWMPVACVHSPSSEIEDLRPVERRRHRGQDAARVRIAHRVLDRLAGERALGDAERAPGSPLRTNRPFLVPTSNSVIRGLQRSRAGRRSGRRRTPACPRSPARR